MEMDILANSVSRDQNGNIIIQADDGSELVVYAFSVMPNDYHSLCEMMKTNTVEVKLYNVKAEGIFDSFRLKMKMMALSKQDAYLIVEGGWIPFSLIDKNALLLADRNVISRMQYRYSLGVLKKDISPDYYDAIFLYPVNIEVDISLFSLESNEKKIPDKTIIDSQIKIAKDILHYSLPGLKRAVFPGVDNYFHSLFERLKPRLKQRMNFFKDVAAALNRGFTPETRKEVIPFIFQKADENGLTKTDIAVMLAFLRITMAGKKTPATEVIKESQTFGEEEGYNVACDLMALEVLMNYISFHKKMKSDYIPCFITKDKGLAKIAALFMNVNSYTSDGERATVTVTLPLDIFSDDTEVQKMIAEYLQ